MIVLIFIDRENYKSVTIHHLRLLHTEDTAFFLFPFAVRRVDATTAFSITLRLGWAADGPPFSFAFWRILDFCYRLDWNACWHRQFRTHITGAGCVG